jgi:hypothetical protein
MVKITKRPETSVDKIYTRYAAKPQEERPYLGASVLGAECMRQLWYAFRWAHPPAELSPRMLRLFDTGHREEERVIDDLRAGGMTVLGQQQSFFALGGHLRGHLDGIVGGLPEAPKTVHVLEIKTHNDKSFKALLIDGVKKSKPVHYAQMMVYMHFLKYERALYVAVNKNDDSIYCERVYYDKKEADALVKRAEYIVTAETAPPKLHEDPDKPAAYVCGWCPAKPVCHDRQPARHNCRTCVSSTVLLEEKGQNEPRAAWYCTYHDKLLTLAEQRAGCPQHQFLSSLLPSLVAA